MISGSTENSSFSKSIMCFFKGNMKATDSELVDLEPKDIPCECEVIIYSRFSIDKLSVINVDEGKFIFIKYELTCILY